jgi:hypothetical protein
MTPPNDFRTLHAETLGQEPNQGYAHQLKCVKKCNGLTIQYYFINSTLSLFCYRYKVSFRNKWTAGIFRTKLRVVLYND